MIDDNHLWPHERLEPVDESMQRLGEVRTAQPEPIRSFIQPQAERLLAEIERLETAHTRRAWIGDRLDRIGDPRPGVGVFPDGTPAFVWCEVPAVDPAAKGRNRQAKATPFHIAKYPVTYAQYKAFVDAGDGYRDPHRWWHGLKREDEPGEQYRLTGNCPAEYVSWYDAVAFCRWASDRLGFEVRLPTEAEWEWAATGGRPGYEYPWGPEWEEGRANTDESRLSRTTAVGMYPAGASPCGALDMAGNVWQWCADKRDSKDKGETVPRVLRGGSWINNQHNARASYRNDNDPDNRNNNIGFRLLCVSHIVQAFNAGNARRSRLPAEAKALWMVQAGPVRTGACASA